MPLFRIPRISSLLGILISAELFGIFSNNVLTARIIFETSIFRGKNPTTVGALLGSIKYQAYDGSTFVTGAQIEGRISKPPSLNKFPTDIVFSTSNATHNLQERARITADGSLIITNIQPPEPPTVLVQAGAGLELGLYRYKITFLTRHGETMPSLATHAVATLASDKQIKINIANTMCPDVLAIKIYRTFVSQEEPFYYVGTISYDRKLAYQSFIDTVPDNLLGPLLPTAQLNVLGNALLGTDLKARLFFSTNTLYSPNNAIPYHRKIDPHGDATVGIHSHYTAPVDGWYYITVYVRSSSAASAENGISFLLVQKLPDDQPILSLMQPIFPNFKIDMCLSGLLLLAQNTKISAAYFTYKLDGTMLTLPIALDGGIDGTSMSVHYVSSGSITQEQAGIPIVPPLIIPTSHSPTSSPDPGSTSCILDDAEQDWFLNQPSSS